MPASMLTLGERWRDYYVAGMTLLHILLSHDVAVAPKGEPTPDTLLQVLRDVAGGRYQPDNYVSVNPGGAPRFALLPQPPALVPGTEYLLIGLNALTARGQFVSVRTGGIVFEEPIWAMLAAHAVSTTSNPRLALPKAKDHEQLWKNLALVVNAVRQGTYRPQDFFAPVVGFVPPAVAPEFTLLSVAADQLLSLRIRGAQALKVTTPPRFFELFKADAP